MKEETKEISKTNYFILGALIVLVISICTATYNVYSIYKEYKKGLVSPLNISKEVDYKELSSTTNEMLEDTFLVISYSGDEDIYENEKALKLVFRKYELLDNIIYVDVTEAMEEENFIEDLNKALSLDDNHKVTAVPTIIYFKEGTVKSVIKSKNGIIDSETLKSIIEKNINVD